MAQMDDPPARLATVVVGGGNRLQRFKHTLRPPTAHRSSFSPHSKALEPRQSTAGHVATDQSTLPTSQPRATQVNRAVAPGMSRAFSSPQQTSQQNSRASSQEGLTCPTGDQHRLSPFRLGRVKALFNTSPIVGTGSSSSLSSPHPAEDDRSYPSVLTSPGGGGAIRPTGQHPAPDTHSDSVILQLEPSQYSDGVYRPGDRLVGTLALKAQSSDGRRVVSVKSKLKGVRECQILIPSDEAEPLFRPDIPKGRTTALSSVTFWLDHCSIFSKDDMAAISPRSNHSSDDTAEPIKARFEFLLPEKLPATYLDDLTPDELARPRRMRQTSRMPIELPPSLDVRTPPISNDEKGEGQTFLDKATDWIHGGRNDRLRWAKVHYGIEVVVKRQRSGWTGRLGPTKKEKLSIPLTIHPHPPFSATVPIPPAPAAAIIPASGAGFGPSRNHRASMIVEPANQFANGAQGERAEHRRSLQVDVGSLTSHLRGPVGTEGPIRSGLEDSLQIVTNERGRVQAWYKHSAIDQSGSVYMEFSFPALASITTDREVPFLLRLSLPKGSRPRPETVRMVLQRSITSTTRFGDILIEDSVPVQTPCGRAAVRADTLIRRRDEAMILPHRVGAEVQSFDGRFVIEGYTVPSTSVAKESTATEGLGLDLTGSSALRKTTLVDPSQRTVPSFSFKNLKLKYGLLVQIGIDTPSDSGSGDYNQGYSQLEIPTICVANEVTKPSTRAIDQGRSTQREESHRHHDRLGDLDISDANGMISSPANSPSRAAQSNGGGRPLSRTQTLPTYSSLYLRDMARRAAGESSPLDRQGEAEEDSSEASENGLEQSTEVRPTEIRERASEMSGMSIPQPAEAQFEPTNEDAEHSERSVEPFPSQQIQSSQGLEQPDPEPRHLRDSLESNTLETPRESIRIQGPSPPYRDCEFFEATPSSHSVLTSGSNGVGSSHSSPLQVSRVDVEEEEVLETATSTEMMDLLLQSTTETLPPEYPVTVRLPRPGNRIDEVAQATSVRGTTPNGSGSGSGGGSSGSSGSSGILPVWDSREREVYLAQQRLRRATQRRAY